MNLYNFNLKILAMIMIPIAIIMLIFDNNEKLEIIMEEKVYKILTLDEWKTSKDKKFIFTELDNKDGFVHLSTAQQLMGTLHYYFKASETLILVEFKSTALGKNLIFEDPFPKTKRTGKFPHYYSKLNFDKISKYWQIKRGSFNLPEEVIAEIEN